MLAVLFTTHTAIATILFCSTNVRLIFLKNWDMLSSICLQQLFNSRRSCIVIWYEISIYYRQRSAVLSVSLAYERHICYILWLDDKMNNNWTEMNWYNMSSNRPCYAALYCILPYCTALYCTILYCTVLYWTVLYWTGLDCTVLYCTVLYCTVLTCTVLYCTVLYCTLLLCTILYCTVLYCTVL